MYVALCEDEPIYMRALTDAIREWERKTGHPDVFVYTYTMAEPLLEDFQMGKIFDLMLLDIEFPCMSGFELAEHIRARDPHVPIAFITNSNNYLQRGYELSIYRYLKKPIMPREIESCLNFAYTQSAVREEEAFFIKRKSGSIRLRYSDVLYFVSGVHSVTAVLANGESYDFSSTLNFKAFTEQLPRTHFVRCHRAFTLNMAHVRRYNPYDIQLNGGHTLKVGPIYQKAVMAHLDAYFRGELLL